MKGFQSFCFLELAFKTIFYYHERWVQLGSLGLFGRGGRNRLFDFCPCPYSVTGDTTRCILGLYFVSHKNRASEAGVTS